MRENANWFLLVGHFISKYGSVTLSAIILFMAVAVAVACKDFSAGMLVGWISMYLFLWIIIGVIYMALYADAYTDNIRKEIRKYMTLGDNYDIQVNHKPFESRVFTVTMVRLTQDCDFDVINESGDRVCHRPYVFKHRLFSDYVISPDGSFITQEQIEAIVYDFENKLREYEKTAAV